VRRPLVSAGWRVARFSRMGDRAKSSAKTHDGRRAGREGRVFARIALACCAAAIVACGSDSPTGTGPTGNGSKKLTLSTIGRLERGNTIRFVAKRDTVTVAPATFTYAAVPATAAQANADGSVKLLATGHVSLIATTIASNAADTLGIDVTVPPTIILDRLVGGVRAIYRASLDGVDTLRVSNGAHDDIMPTTARDTIVFVSFRDGNAELYSVPANGGTEKRLTTTAANETSPSLSPTASTLVYVSNASGLDRLWTSALNGTGAAPSTDALPSELQENPRWSATGDRVLFVSTALGSAALFLTTPPGTAKLPLIAGAPSAVDPAWAFDGQSVAFVSGRSDAPGPGLYSYILQNATPTLLVSGSDVGQPTFLRDGRIVFTRFASNSSKLQWVDPSDPTTVHDIALTGSPAHAVAP
jgi:Tol biopolymer transport system component